MDMNLSLQNEVTGKGIDFTKQFSTFLINKLSELGIQYNNTLSLVFTIFIGALLIFFGLKIAHKVMKVVLIILGGILVIGTISVIFGI